MTGWTSVNENIRVLTRNIRILLPPSSPAPAPAWHFSSTPTCPPPLLLCKLCIQEAGRGEPDLDKIVTNIFLIVWYKHLIETTEIYIYRY